MRIGHGYDVHRLVPDRKLILGGVDIPYEKGLLGHSDADVLVHALMDALLGAAAMGDIGKLFPDNDERYLGADSLVLLREVMRRLREAGANIAEAMSVPAELISVKATTEEGLGFTGSGEGIAAHAVVLIK